MNKELIVFLLCAMVCSWGCSHKNQDSNEIKQQTKRPSTYEELVQSHELTKEISLNVSKVVDEYLQKSMDSNVSIDSLALRQKILLIRGVKNVYINKSSTSALIQQEDGMTFNYIIKAMDR